MVQRKPKKKKTRDELPEGMSRREAKLAARAAEREQFQKDPRPFGGLAAEADLVALQEFVPSAIAEFEVNGTPVNVVTVLPGAGGALVREEAQGGGRFVALQATSHSQNPGRDLAYALNWVLSAEPGETLQSTAADGSQPELASLIAADATPTITNHQDFAWWFPEGTQIPPQIQQAMRQANDAVLPSQQLGSDLPGSIWWVNPDGGKAHIRWVRTEDNEAQMLAALARIAAEVNGSVENIGARRLYTVIERVFEELSFSAPDKDGETVQVDAAYVERHLGDLARSTDLSRYVL